MCYGDVIPCRYTCSVFSRVGTSDPFSCSLLFRYPSVSHPPRCSHQRSSSHHISTIPSCRIRIHIVLTNRTLLRLLGADGPDHRNHGCSPVPTTAGSARRRHRKSRNLLRRNLAFQLLQVLIFCRLLSRSCPSPQAAVVPQRAPWSAAPAASVATGKGKHHRRHRPPRRPPRRVPSAHSFPVAASLLVSPTPSSCSSTRYCRGSCSRRGPSRNSNTLPSITFA